MGQGRSNSWFRGCANVPPPRATTVFAPGVALQRFRQLAKSAGFGEPKSTFSSVPKNLGDGLPFAGFDSRIQIHKIPIQAPGQLPAHAALAGSHESH